MTKRIISLMLVAVMLLSLCGVGAFADDGESIPVTSEDSSMPDDAGGELTADGEGDGNATADADVSAGEKTAPDAPADDTVADDGTTAPETEDDPDSNVTEGEVTDPDTQETEPPSQPPVEQPSIEEDVPAVSEPAEQPEIATVSIDEGSVASVGDQGYTSLADAIKNAGGQEVKLLKSITLADNGNGYALAITSDVVIDLGTNLITIENTQSKDNFMGIDFQSTSGTPVKATLKNGTVSMASSTGTAIMLFSADLTLSNVKMDTQGTAVTVMNLTAPSTLDVGAGTTITATRPVQHHGALKGSGSPNTNTVKVSGGSLIATGSYAAINDTDNGGSAVNINVTQGTVNGGASAAGIMLMSNGIISVSGGTVTGSSGIVMTNGTVNVDGGSVTATGNYNASAGDRGDQGIDEDGSAIMVISGASGAIGGGNVKVNITQGNVTSANGYAVSEMAAKTQTGGSGAMDATVSGGTLTGGASVENAAIHTTNVENTSVTGGKFSSNVSEYVDAEAVAQVGSGANSFIVGEAAIKEAASQLSEGSITVYQGDVELTELQNGVTVSNEGEGNVSANGETVEQGSDVTVGEEKPAEKTLQQLITEAEEGGTVKLEKSYDECIVIPDGKTITIDLNGNTISGSNADTIVIGKGATVIIQDSKPGNYGTVTNTGNFRSIVNKGTLTLDGGTYTREDGTNNYVIFNDGCSEEGVVGTLTLQRGEVNSNSATSSCICNDEGIINISSYITIEAAYNPIKNNPCAQAGKGKVTISGATIRCTDTEHSFAIQNNAELVIESGSITGDVTTLSGDGFVGDDSYIGKTTITGGHITGNVSCGPMESGMKPENAPTVTITGGTVSGEVYAVTCSDGSTVSRNDQETNAKFSISGGTFTSEVKTEFIAEGVAEAKVKDTYYVGATINSHISTLHEGDTIEVLTGDLTLDGVATGVTVTNSGKGTVTVDGQDVPADGGSITTQERVDIVIEMNTSYEAPEDNPLMPHDDFIFSLLSSLCAFPGGTINYSFDVYIPSGHTSSEAKNVVVTDKLPEGFTAKTVSKNNDNVTYNYDSGSNTMTWTIKSIKGTGKSNKVTVSVGLEIPEVPTQAGWENYATSTLDNGISDSYRSTVTDKFADEQQEKQFYSYFLGLDANGGTDNADGLPYFFFQIKHQFDVEDITAAPEVELPFPGNWYIGYGDGADSYGGDPTPDAGMGDDVIFAGWSTTQHEGVQDEKPEDMVAEIADKNISGSYTFKGISVLYAVYAHDTDGDGNPNWKEPVEDTADLTELEALLEKAKGIRDAKEASKHIQNLEVLDGPIEDAEALVLEAPIEKARQEEVDSTVSELNEAIEQLLYNSNVHVSIDGTLTVTSSVMKDERATGMMLTLNVVGDDEDVDSVEFAWTEILEQDYSTDKYFSAPFNKGQGTLRILITDLGSSRVPILDMEGDGRLNTIVLGVIKLKNAEGKTISGKVSVTANALSYTTSTDISSQRDLLLKEDTWSITSVELADMSGLKKLVEEAEALTPAAYSNFASITPALQIARDLLKQEGTLPKSEQEVVNEAAKNLREAMEGLKLIDYTLTISNTVTGKDADKELRFNYEITLLDTEGEPVNDAVISFKDSSLLSAIAAFFTKDDNTGFISSGESIGLKAGESATIEGLHYGYTYTIEQTEVENYTKSVVGNEDGTIDRNVTVAFANTYKAPVAPPEPPAEKGDKVIIEEDGTVKVISDHMEKEGVQTIAVALNIDTAYPIDQIKLTFVFDEGITSIIKSARQNAQNPNLFTIRISGTNPVFAKDATEVTLGKLKVELNDTGEAVKATVTVSADGGLKYVLGGTSEKSADIDDVEVTLDGTEPPVAAADTSALEDAIANAESINPAEYDPAVFAPVRDALVKANALLAQAKAGTLTSKDQQTIDDAVEALNNAVNALPKKVGPANLTDLQRAVNAATALDPTEYEDFSDVEAALAVANDLIKRGAELTEDDQDEIDQATNALDTAVQNLQKITPTDSVYVTTGGTVTLRSNHFAREGVRTITVKVELVPVVDNANVDFTFNPAFGNDAYITALRHSNDAPNIYTIYITSINAPLMEKGTETLLLGSFSVTNTRGENVKTALTIAEDGLHYFDDDSTDQAATIPAVEVELTGIEPIPAELDDLKQAVQDAKEKELQSALYVNFDDVASALSKAEALLKREEELTDEDQDEIDGVTAELTEAMDALEYKPADLSKLQQAIQRANDLDPDEYRDFTEVEQLLDEALALAARKDLDIRNQTEIDQKALYLNTAINNLEKKDIQPEVKADYSEVDTAKAKASALNRELYTEESLKKVDDAVEAVVEGLLIEKQHEVDAMADAINDALLALKYKPVDTTELNKALQRAASLTHTNEAVDSAWNVAGDLMAQAAAGNIDIRSQARVNAAAQALNKAIDDLLAQPQPADYTAVDKAISDAQKLIGSGLYTEDSVAALQEAIDNVDRNKTAEEQDEVDAMAKAIEDAMDALVRKPVPADYTKVDEAIAKAQQYIDSGRYTEGSINVLKAAIDAVDRTKMSNEQAAVDAMAQAIEDAIKALVLKPSAADYSKVEAAVKEANERIASGLYTDESISALEDALDQVVFGLTSDKQAEVDAMAKDIEDAIKALQYKQADKTALNDAVAKAKELDEALYKDFADVTEALAEANAVLAKDNATDAEVKAALDKLNSAVSALEYKDADMEALNEAIDKAEKLVKEDYADFTAVELALATAKELAEKENLDIRDQTDIDAAVKALEDAITALEPAPTATPAPTETPAPTTTPNPTATPNGTTNGPAAPATGDNTNMGLWVCIIAVCLCGLCAAGYVCLRKRKSQK